MARAMLMEHAEDPRNLILKNLGIKKFGDLPGFELFGNSRDLITFFIEESLEVSLHRFTRINNEKVHNQSTYCLVECCWIFVSTDFSTSLCNMSSYSQTVQTSVER